MYTVGAMIFTEGSTLLNVHSSHLLFGGYICTCQDKTRGDVYVQIQELFMSIQGNPPISNY